MPTLIVVVAADRIHSANALAQRRRVGRLDLVQAAIDAAPALFVLGRHTGKAALGVVGACLLEALARATVSADEAVDEAAAIVDGCGGGYDAHENENFEVHRWDCCCFGNTVVRRMSLVVLTGGKRKNASVGILFGGGGLRRVEFHCGLCIDSVEVTSFANAYLL